MTEPLMTWDHPDGRQVVIYPDRKIRHGYTMPDEWPILYRTSVPALTDPEWFASPGDGWTTDYQPGEGWPAGALPP